MNSPDPNPKFAPIYQKHTNGINYGLDTDDIIQKLAAWDAQYGIEISDVEDDALTVRFNSLPDELGELAQEIYEFCPDVIEQHFGCMDDMVAMVPDSELPPDLAALVAGVNFDDENFGEILLQRFLRTTHSVPLWWD